MKFPNWPIHSERELELLRAVLASDRWGGYHPIVEEFERRFAAFQHCQFGVCAVNGTVTLEMMLAAAGIGSGDEVIVPAISFISTASAVSRVGATPVFVDIEPDTFNIDPAALVPATSAATKAVFAVHFGGPLADMDQLAAFAVQGGYLLLEDAAHAHGSEWRGRRAGSIGLAGSFSFQNSKVMTSGEGGIVTTNDAAFAERIRSLANQGRKTGGGWFHHYTLGTNHRISALQAAVLVAQLERLPQQIALRGQRAAMLRSLTAEVPGLRWQRVAPQVTANALYLMLGRIDATRFGMTRDDFCRELTHRGIPCAPFYPHPLYGNPMYEKLPLRVMPCPVAEACVNDTFWLPHRVLLADEDSIAELAALIGDLSAGARAQSRVSLSLSSD